MSETLSILRSRQPVMYLLAFCAIIAIASMFFPDVPGVTPIYQNLASWISILIGFVFVPATLSLIIRLVKSVQKNKRNGILMHGL